MNINLTMQQIAAVRAMLPDDDDDQLLADCLEGETDLHKVAGRLLNGIEDDESHVAVLTIQVEDRKTRQDRFKRRVESRRRALQALMDCAGLSTLTLPEATLSTRKIAPKPMVVDPDKLPDEFVDLIRKPSLVRIKEADTLPPGVTMDNGGSSLTIRRK